MTCAAKTLRCLASVAEVKPPRLGRTPFCPAKWFRLHRNPRLPYNPLSADDVSRAETMDHVLERLGPFEIQRRVGLPMTLVISGVNQSGRFYWEWRTLPGLQLVQGCKQRGGLQ